MFLKQFCGDAFLLLFVVFLSLRFDFFVDLKLFATLVLRLAQSSAKTCFAADACWLYALPAPARRIAAALAKLSSISTLMILPVESNKISSWNEPFSINSSPDVSAERNRCENPKSRDSSGKAMKSAAMVHFSSKESRGSTSPTNRHGNSW